MLGMDISNWQAGARPGSLNTVAYSALDTVSFVIVKATEGTGYTNPYFATHFDYCKSRGKLMGAYHYANGGDAKAEARHFYNTIKSRLGETVPCLDWEGGSNNAWGSKTWAKSFCDEFHNLSGIWPMVYVQASAVAQVASCAKTALCG